VSPYAERDDRRVGGRRSAVGLFLHALLDPDLDVAEALEALRVLLAAR
jgi:hypothetical protein